MFTNHVYLIAGVALAEFPYYIESCAQFLSKRTCFCSDKARVRKNTKECVKKGSVRLKTHKNL